ncbi:MAG: CoA pyrophosphatase [Archaeoglobaceae archaeon]
MRIEILQDVLDEEVSYSHPKSAAVLIPIINSASPQLLMIQRAFNLKRNAGEIAFPGGFQEGEETPKETALRELKEELGIDGQEVKILGYLQPKELTRYKIYVYPVVGLMGCIEKKLVPGFEVRKVLIGDFLHIFSTRTMNDKNIFYEFCEHNVEGVTSKILDDLHFRLTKKLKINEVKKKS